MEGYLSWDCADVCLFYILCNVMKFPSHHSSSAVIVWHCSNQCFLRDVEKLSPTTGWCSKKRFGCVGVKHEDCNCIHTFILLSFNITHGACNLIFMWLNPHDIWVRNLKLVLYSFFSKTFFLQSTGLMVGTKAKPGQESRLSDETTATTTTKRQDTQISGRKQWNWAGMVAVNNAGGRSSHFMVWDPAPKPRSLFLPAMYCSLHLSRYEPHSLQEARQNNETMRLHREKWQFSTDEHLACGL